MRPIKNIFTPLANAATFIIAIFAYTLMGLFIAIFGVESDKAECA